MLANQEAGIIKHTLKQMNGFVNNRVLKPIESFGNLDIHVDARMLTP